MRWALPLVLLSLMAGCTAVPSETLEPAGNATTTTTTPTLPANTTEPTAGTPPSNATTPTPPTAPTPPTPSPPPRPAPEVFEDRGSATASVGGATAPGEETVLAFKVKPGATRVTAFAWWNGTAPTDFDLVVHDPTSCAAKEVADEMQCLANATGKDPGAHVDEGGTPAEPDPGAKVEIDLRGKTGLACGKADGCAWSAEAKAKTAGQADWHLLVVVEYA